MLFFFLSSSWIIDFFTLHNVANVKYLAVVFEDSISYLGKEVSTLSLFSSITLKFCLFVCLFVFCFENESQHIP